MIAAPNVEERLASAAFTILTDDNCHDDRARVWAVHFLHVAAHGRGTAFQRRVALASRTSRARAFADGVGA